MSTCMKLLAATIIVSMTGVLRADDSSPPQGGKEAKLVKVKAAEIEKIIAAYKGKVIAIDVWADFCAPCKKAFPHLIELHQRYAKDGLVCISLSVDPEEGFEGALEFLQKRKAVFSNYILWDSDENKDALQKKFDHVAIPIFHVYDRRGEHVKMWEGAIKHDEIESLIQRLLKND